jgi:hypothetical protein
MLDQEHRQTSLRSYVDDKYFFACDHYTQAAARRDQ